MKNQRFTAVLHKEDDWYVSLCPELDIASQGPSIEESLANLKEAVELFLSVASTGEISGKLHGNTFVTQFEAKYAKAG